MCSAGNLHEGQPAFTVPLNPFSTRNVSPGAVDYIFPPGEDAQKLVEKLRSSGWRGQIVGPHGSGKSTLVSAIIPALERAGMSVLRFSLHDDVRALTRGWQKRASMRQPLLILIDGYEQLSWRQRIRLRWFCRRRGAGLLVTAHAAVGLPELWRTKPSLELAEAIVLRLLPRGENRIGDADVRAAYTDSGGDLREVFFRLYDVYESRRRSGR